MRKKTPQISDKQWDYILLLKKEASIERRLAAIRNLKKLMEE